MNIKRIGAVSLTLVLLFGCKADPKELNDETITGALNSYYESDPACVEVAKELLVRTEVDDRRAGELEAFVDASLLQKTEIVEERPKGLPRLDGKEREGT